ncbi:MAG: hypothetical protein QNL68_13495 [Akkermansiaceae bacterium]
MPNRAEILPTAPPFSAAPPDFDDPPQLPGKLPATLNTKSSPPTIGQVANLPVRDRAQ